MPVFNAEEYLEKWEDDNPAVVIPNEVEEEIDNDWVMNEEEED